MQDLPTDRRTVCADVSLPGMRRGFDADLPAAVEGSARLSSPGRRTHARHCRAPFALSFSSASLSARFAVTAARFGGIVVSVKATSCMLARTLARTLASSTTARRLAK